jgi:hypothetical protein
MYKKQHPMFFPHMNNLEYIEAMEAKGFHFTDKQKADAKKEQGLQREEDDG